MRVVINRTHGGFGISCEALLRAAERGAAGVRNLKAEEWRGQSWLRLAPLRDGWQKSDAYSVIMNDSACHDWDGSNRTDPVLIQIVEEMGDAANGQFAKLRIVEVPDGVEFEIEDHDGIEHIAELHRTGQ